VSEERLKELMFELIGELQKTKGLSPEVMTHARRLETEVHDLINPEVDTSDNTILDDAIALEAAFATSHPVAEKILRELVNTLSRLGI